MRRTHGFLGLGLIVATGACNTPPVAEAPAATPAAKVEPAQSPAERGKYLVTVGGCDDCHSPKIFTPEGVPEPDPARRLSGHPAADKLPNINVSTVLGPGKFGAIGSGDFTAWVGPWGTTYTMNLTPDKTTGLGSWNEAMFIKALRTGKHQGEGRPILPPMPYFNFAKMTDDDLKAVWAFLQTLPPIQNAIPDPVPPPGALPAAKP